MTCSVSHHMCNKCAFLALMIIITIYYHIRFFSAAPIIIYEYSEAQNSKKLRILKLSKILIILMKKMYHF